MYYINILYAQQDDAVDRSSSEFIATVPARKNPDAARPLILGVGLKNMEDTEFHVNKLIFMCKTIMSPADIKIALTYNQSREWGIAVEHIYSTIIEEKITINSEIFNQFKICLNVMTELQEDMLVNLLNHCSNI